MLDTSPSKPFEICQDKFCLCVKCYGISTPIQVQDKGKWREERTWDAKCGKPMASIVSQ